jgi:UDP-glucose 4-epimerase
MAPEPVNPYGETKLAGEWLVRDATHAWGLRALSLRYFNVAGAASALLNDSHALNLIPITLRALAAGERPRVYGTDYPTPDGSCVRDYVHVLDLADAHVAALHHVVGSDGSVTPPALNVGTGAGSSVLEVMEEVARATGTPFEPERLGRRAGDPAQVVAEVGLIHRTLGWRARHDLASIVRSAVAADGGSTLGG